ncbi:MAG TPA: 3-hydroxyacyl-CoA dehydrogenase family protein [Galbitalea sp.]|nr:3-hydroxyacyl-CoA dehydrogenase family protein [Galbitalea sp.]
MSIPSVLETSVVGSGYMGGGIAQVFANAGHHVTLADVDAQTAANARERLVDQAEVFEEQGLFTPGSRERIAQNLTAAESIEAAVANANYVTEAVPEVMDIKRETLQRISAAVPEDCVIGSNTSAIPIEQLSEVISQRERFLGVHWMNPAPFIPGVEIIASTATDSSVVDYAEALIRSLGKITARVADTPGFVANRLQFALYKEAAKMVEEAVASPSEIDAVVSNTFGFRLALFGPFAIGDMAGLDVYNSAYSTLEAAYGERFAAPSALADLVKVGNLGIKSGAGFLDIPESDRGALLVYRDKSYALLSQLREHLGSAPGL